MAQYGPSISQAAAEIPRWEQRGNVVMLLRAGRGDFGEPNRAPAIATLGRIGRDSPVTDLLADLCDDDRYFTAAFNALSQIVARTGGLILADSSRVNLWVNIKRRCRTDQARLAGNANVVVQMAKTWVNSDDTYWALAQIPDPRIVQFMLDNIREPEGLIRHGAVSALQNMLQYRPQAFHDSQLRSARELEAGTFITVSGSDYSWDLGTTEERVWEPTNVRRLADQELRRRGLDPFVAHETHHRQSRAPMSAPVAPSSAPVLKPICPTCGHVNVGSHRRCVKCATDL